MAGRRGLPGAAAVLLLLAASVAAEDPGTLAGMDAVVYGDWAAACEAFSKVEGDPRSNLRLSAARKQAIARLAPALEALTKQKRWTQLAEAGACGLAIDPSHYRYTGAVSRAAKAGVAELPAVDARVHPWAAYGMAFGEAQVLIKGCLDFLEKTQEAEGDWDCAEHGGGGSSSDPGVTALALLALLPHRRPAADRAAQALLKMQDPDGCFGSSGSSKWAYNTGFATEALARYALATGQVDRCRDALRKSVEYLVDARSSGGGWRYERRGSECDTSVTVHVVCALHAAERAGVKVDPEAFRGARAWMTSMTDPNFGQVGYNFPGGAAARPAELQNAFPPERTQSMTAAACVAQVCAGASAFQLGKSFSLLREMPPMARYPDMYYWDLATRAYVRAWGQIPAPWYGALVEAATPCRAEDGGMKACDVWSSDGGRIYTTAITALALAAPYAAERPQGSARAFLEEGSRTVTVSAAEHLTPTGIYVESGMVLEVQAQGALCPYRDGPMIGPEGTREKLRGPAKPVVGKAPFCCLLAQVDDGEPFVPQLDKKNTMRGFGHLWLFVNDEGRGDNFGAFEVRIGRAR
jgi:hypothetical protein